MQTVPSLANLPSLRVLVLIQNWYKFTAGQDTVLGRDMVDSFQRLPNLEYIIHRYSSKDKSHYMKLSLSPSLTEDILREELDIHYDPAVPWWSIYNV